jgi:hypothetical protein
MTAVLPYKVTSVPHTRVMVRDNALISSLRSHYLEAEIVV